MGRVGRDRWIAEPHYYAGTSEIYIQSYLGPNFTGRRRRPLVSPIENPNLAKMCPTYLCCGAEDAFLSHTLAMAGALALRDVPVMVSVVEGADHEFLRFQGPRWGRRESRASQSGCTHISIARNRNKDLEAVMNNPLRDCGKPSFFKVTNMAALGFVPPLTDGGKPYAPPCGLSPECRRKRW